MRGKSIIEKAGFRVIIDPEAGSPSRPAVHIWYKNTRLVLDRLDPTSGTSRRRVIVAAVAAAGRRKIEIDAFSLEKLFEDAAAKALAGRRQRSASDNGKAEQQVRVVAFSEPEPWPEPVDGSLLLERLSAWVRRYVWLSVEAADAIAAWAAATWFVQGLYFAPILALLSATRRCGKTLLLDLLRPIVRRGYLTSGVGVTAAVVFRLNELHRPTLLVDEAEKLSGRHADRDLIAMLNAGHRRGATVQRCFETGGDYVVREFDAFGFRALAAIRTLWDTVLDRSIVVNLERKPRAATVERFNGQVVAGEGEELARQLRRWVDDNREAIAEAETSTPRPLWLHDRACDNWAPLLAVAEFADGEWPQRILAAARMLSASIQDDGDLGERIIQDIRRVFEADDWPDVIKSGQLAAKLNALDDAPWGDQRNGKGISTHKLATMLRPFGVRPDHRRSEGGSGPDVRGYWLEDLESVFSRYPPSQSSQASQPSGDLGPGESLDPTPDASRDSLESSENPRETGHVTHVTVPPGDRWEEEPLIWEESE